MTIQWLTLSTQKEKKIIRGSRESSVGDDLPEVRNEVSLEHLKEPKLSNRVVQNGGPNKDPNVRDDDLHPLLRREDRCVGVKV